MLRDPAGGRISADERVERKANAQASGEYRHRRDPEREPVLDNVDRPQWCPVGLTRSQKRRVQKLCQTELLEEERKGAPKKKEVRSEVWHVKPKADDRKDPESSAAPVNIVIGIANTTPGQCFSLCTTSLLGYV